MKNFFVLVSLMMLCGFTFAGSKAVSEVQQQACAGEVIRIRHINMDSVRIDRQVRWGDGSAAVRLSWGDTHGTCWIGGDGNIEQMTFDEGVAPGREQACAGEASLIGGVPMSAVRSIWSAEGPGGSAWVLLRLKGKQADCHVSGSWEVLEIIF